MKTPTTINPNLIKSRDLTMVRLINGSTKSGYQKDKRREANKKACRKGNYGADY